ncbi:MAG: hypothetical protein J6A59_12590 [Lachnospiraceae bacterium]|nr:hypothetical protein [Lachnospiraceae bacterium]
MKKIMRLTFLITLVIPIIFNVYSVRAIEHNFETLTYREQSQIILDIVTSVSQGVTDGIENSAPYMTEQVYTDLVNDSNDKVIQGSIGQLAVDTIDIINSSTGDTVVMANIKVWSQAQTYNNLYLYEFHINKDGKIYGYNLWVY